MPRDMQQVDRLRKIAEEMDKIREKTGSIRENLAAKIIREAETRAGTSSLLWPLFKRAAMSENRET